MNVLEKEVEFFERRKEDWNKTYPEKFVLIKGEELIGTYDTAEAAVAEGARRFGATSFLVRRLGQTDEIVFIPALSLGLLYARS